MKNDDDPSENAPIDDLDGDLLDAGLARAWGAAGKLPPLDGIFGGGDGAFDIDDVLDLGAKKTAPHFSDVDVVEAARAIEKTGRYLVRREVGRGGMGVVLAATDRRIGRVVALKLLHGLPVGDPRRSRRFVEEAQIAGQLEHPGICPVYDVGMLDGRRPFIAMKFVEGETFADLLRRRTTCSEYLERCLDVFLRVAEALAYAHARGVVHRDLKPANILLGSFGETLVTDWGLAKVVDEGHTRDRAPISDNGAANMRTIRDKNDGMKSTVGAVMGTPAYMAPEQLEADPEAVDARTDVFLLGGMLAEILTGKSPFPGLSTDELRVRPFADLLAEVHRRLDESGFDPALIAVAKCALSHAKSDRPASAADVGRAVESYRASLLRRAKDAEIEKEAAMAVAASERRHGKKVAMLSGLAALLFFGIAALWTVFTVRDAARRDDVRRTAEIRRSAAEDLIAAGDLEGALVEAKRAVDLLHTGDPRGSAVEPAEALAQRIGRSLDDRRRRDASRASETRLLRALAELRIARFEEIDLNDVDASYVRLFSEFSTEGGNPRSAVRAAERRGEIVQGFFDWWILRRYAYSPTEERWWAPPLAALSECDENVARIAIRKDLEKGDVDGALKTAETRMSEIDAAILSGIAIAVNREKGATRLAEFLDAAVAAHPRDYFLRFERGMARTRAQPPRFDEAILDFAAADSLFDDGGLAALNTGICLARVGRPAEAARAFLRVRGRKRLEARALQGIVAAHIALGDFTRAEEDLVRLKAIADEKQKTALLEFQGEVAMKRERFDEALAALDALIAANPSDFRSLFRRSELHLRRGAMKKAVDDLEASLRLAPDDWRVRYRLGTRYFLDGKLDDAHIHLLRAVTLNPSSAAAHINLGQCRVRLGRPEEALGHLLFGKILGAPPGVPIDEYIAACRREIEK